MDFDVTTGFPSIPIRLRSAGTDATGSSTYKTQNLRVAGSATATGDFANSDGFNELFYSNNAGTNGAQFAFYRPYLADTTAVSSSFTSISSNTGYVWLGSGYHNQDVSYDGFSFVVVSASSFSGKLRVYGWQE
jgi:hypothetical protein